MDYTDLDEITNGIIAIIQPAITAAWPAAGIMVRPRLLRNDDEGLGFYLYHVQENAHYKNYPSPGNDIPPMAFTPMSLNLFYQLSANIRDNTNQDAIREQEIMSVAMKVLHDNPVITRIPSPGIPAGKQINIKITLQMLTPSDSIQYWAAAESPVRLSAYYEVSVVFMHPETTRSYAGRVLTYGNYILVQGAPQITSSQNTIRFLTPTSPTPMEITIQPAQAPPAIVSPAPINSVVSFFGTGFNAGTLQLLLISSLWPEAAVADAAWNVRMISENQVDADVQPTAILRTALTVVDILPGLYAAQIGVSKQITLPGGATKTFNHFSNQFPFCVMPRIDAITVMAPDEFRVQCYLFQHGTDIRNDDIQIYTGETKLEPQPVGVLTPGRFQITAFDTIELKAPATAHGPNVPLRIMIRGIESEPRWVNIP